MLTKCPNCSSKNIAYRWSQPSLAGGMEYDVYKCEDCQTFTEVKPEYIVLADDDATAIDARPDCGEGLNW